MSDLIICRTPEMAERKRWDEGVKWCFQCRKRIQFWQILRVASMEDAIASMGFWTHDRTIKCECGHLDGDCFPGTSREWGE